MKTPIIVLTLAMGASTKKSREKARENRRKGCRVSGALYCRA
jgi:hypothetical protein